MFSHHSQYQQSQPQQGDGRKMTEEDLEDIEATLMELAGNVVEEWKERQQQTTLELAAFAAFSSDFDWGRDKFKVGHPPLELSYINVFLASGGR